MGTESPEPGDPGESRVQNGNGLPVPRGRSIDSILHSLQERAKELNCLFAVDRILDRPDEPEDAVLAAVVKAIPSGWQFPEICRCSIDLDNRTYGTASSSSSTSTLTAPIRIENKVRGMFAVSYEEPRPASHEGPFQKEERRLIDVIAERIAVYLQRNDIRSAHASLVRAAADEDRRGASEWSIILDFMRRIDPPLFSTIIRKMINYLCWTGVDEAIGLLKDYLAEEDALEFLETDRHPWMSVRGVEDLTPLAEQAFGIAQRNFSEDEIVGHLQAWIEENKAAALVEMLETADNGIADIAASLERFVASESVGNRIASPLQTSLGASLLRRFVSDDLAYIGLMKRRVEVSDFADLVKRVIYTPRSHGRLGGKAAGHFRSRILLRTAGADRSGVRSVLTPKTWYVTSDGVLEFMRHNDLDDVHAHKYQDSDRIRKDYPHLVRVFKNSRFPPEIENRLAESLDDFGETPLIVRSSSLLEDKPGYAFSGMYKSVFLANQGYRSERLAALVDAVAEVYASTFAPDAIEYRSRRGLLDEHEEMAVMIQEVVGVRAGRYFLPSFSGFALSQNDTRWSPLTRRQDGLIGLVPGLAKPAPARPGDRLPVLVAPGQPRLRAARTPGEVIRTSPQTVDVIDLVAGEVRSISLDVLVAEVGSDLPLLRQIVSGLPGDQAATNAAFLKGHTAAGLAANFEGMIEDGGAIHEIRDLLAYFEETLGYPVHLEFAGDGKDLYLLQCRAQGSVNGDESGRAPGYSAIARVLFTAEPFVTFGSAPDVTHVLYVDPVGYGALETTARRMEVAAAVGRLNGLLPQRGFILMAPGCWDSRSGSVLGIGAGFHDVDHAAAILETIYTEGDEAPEVFFDGQFFENLVGAEIRYLLIHPVEPGGTIHHSFFTESESVLAELLPEYAHLDPVLRVIDIAKATGGLTLRLVLNEGGNQAVGLLS